MHNLDDLRLPEAVPGIEANSRAAGFNMASDRLTGSLLRTLAATKPGGAILELGTGTGLSAAWLLAGMDPGATLKTVDCDTAAVEIARRYLAANPQVSFYIEDGELFLARLVDQTFDLVFADTWPGKYTNLPEALNLVKPGGIYVIDDMLPQPNWPEGHAEKVALLIETLERHADFAVTRLNWSTGIMLAVRMA